MKRLMIAGSIILMVFPLLAQNDNDSRNTAQRLLSPAAEQRAVIGGYGQIDYNQPIGNGVSRNGKLDVHRLVLLFGYHFSDRMQLITEIEYEHVKEVYVEQAFLNYRLNDFMNLRGGLMLIPMGIVNEYHEPPLFNGVERPNVDKYLVPTTWREIGAGVSGTLAGPSLKYQAYIVNGFLGFDGASNFHGSSGLRGGRQKGAESIISSPNYTMKLEYFGLPGLNIGLSGYFGKSQSTLFNKLDRDDDAAKAAADSSVVGVAMLGTDLRYVIGGLQGRAQVIYSLLANTGQYNSYTGSDLGSSMLGYYLELSYNILPGSDDKERKLVPFVRYENYNTHLRVEGGISANDTYNRTDITAGLGYWFTSGTVVKADYQRFTNAAGDGEDQINFGIGFMF